MNRFCVIVGIVLSVALPVRAADVILNEYNAVNGGELLEGDGSDTYWGIVEGNGGDWFELAVITDHLDMRGWKLVISDATGSVDQAIQTLTLTNDPIWSDLRSGTIITVSEDLGNNVDDYNPAVGHWWINVKASDDSSGTYITNANFKVSNNNWQLTIKDALDQMNFGPAGEGITPASGVGGQEVCKLEADPSSAITPLSDYNDGSSSTFGSPNVWNDGANVQDFSTLRSVVPFFQLTNVRINEVLTHTDPTEDFIELFNTTASPVDISNWFLSDSVNNLKRFKIPNGTTIAAGGYKVFFQSELGFGLDSGVGDEVYLSEADVGGNFSGGRDFISFGAAANGVSFGRYPNGTGKLYAMSAVTVGAANALPLVGPIVINEIMYHPSDLSGGADNVDEEYIELHNITGAPKALSTFFSSVGETHPWKLSGAVTFSFVNGTTIPADGFLLVVSFNPAVDTAKYEAFRTKYSIGPSAPIVGPYTGKLSNSADTVQLLKPDTPQDSPQNFVPYVLVDEVPYTDIAPWPTTPDGTGPSLERVNAAALGDNPANWVASATPRGTPDCPNDQDAGLAVTIAAAPSANICAGGTITLDAGPGFDHYDWSTGETTRTIATTTTGTYTVAVTGGDGCQGIDTIDLTFGADTEPPVITNCPGSLTLTLDADCHFVSIPEDLNVEVTDNCTPVEDLTFTTDPEELTDLEIGDNSVTVIVTDAAGNFDHCAVTVTVERGDCTGDGPKPIENPPECGLCAPNTATAMPLVIVGLMTLLWRKRRR